MTKKRILILGAGLAGLSAAWHLQRAGVDCQVFEKEAEVGGLCRSKENNGFTSDYSGHLLHFKHDYSLSLIKSLLGKNISRHKRSAWFYSFARFNRYPFQVNLYGLPKTIVKDCLLGFARASRNGHPAKEGISFQSWISKTFGKGIARHFMIPYNRKFWTVPLDGLTCEWIGDFVPVPSLLQVIEGAIKQSRRNLGYNALFWYPLKGGIGRLAQAFSQQIKYISKQSKVTKIDLKRKKIKLNNKHAEKFDFLISTIPLPEFSLLLEDIPGDVAACLRNLSWNSIFNLNLGIERRLDNSRHWAYFPEKHFCFFRVGFPYNFSSSLTPPGKSSLYIDVSYSANKPIDKPRLILRIKKDLISAGILRQREKICVEDINDIKYGYPVYDYRYRHSREKILEFLTENNVLSCGRYGSWRYMSMEDALLDGKRAAGQLF